MISAASPSAPSIASWARSAASNSSFSADRPASSTIPAACEPRWVNDGVAGCSSCIRYRAFSAWPARRRSCSIRLVSCLPHSSTCRRSTPRRTTTNSGMSTLGSVGGCGSKALTSAALTGDLPKRGGGTEGGMLTPLASPARTRQPSLLIDARDPGSRPRRAAHRPAHPVLRGRRLLEGGHLGLLGGGHLGLLGGGHLGGGRAGARRPAWKLHRPTWPGTTSPTQGRSPKGRQRCPAERPMQ